MVLFAVAGVLLGWGTLSWLARRPAFAFEEVVVTTPLAHVNGAYLEAAIRADLQGTFFSMDLDRGRRALGEVPWVRQASLRRQWPHRLEIAIEEHVPLARWNDGALVNRAGELFKASYKGNLPRFVGPDGAVAEMARWHRDWGSALVPFALAIDEMRLSARGGWHLHVQGEDVSLGIELPRDDPGAGFARFLAAYERTIRTLARAGTHVEQVDLRYRNGFAVRVPGFRERTQKRIAS
jgi:cell division protein FtsQ